MTIPLFEGLQPKQVEFAQCTAKYRLMGGAKGGGKSFSMRSEVVRQCLSRPGVRGLALRRTYMEITENMINPLLEELPTALYRYNASEHVLTFYNGSTIRFAFCKNTKDVMQYQGVQYDFICIEELTHWKEKEWKILMTSLRTGKSGIVPNFFASTNPGGIGHAWVKRLFVLRKFIGNENPEEYAFIPSKVWDNQILVKNDPNYVQTLLNLPETEKRAFLDGDWNVFIGQYFKEFRSEVHVVAPYVPRVNVVKRIVAFDYGYAAPSAVLWMAQLDTGKVVVYRELYVTEHTYKQLGLRIKAMTGKDEKIDLYICDPAIINKKSETSGITGGQSLSKVGVNVKPAINDRIDGWQVVRGYMQAQIDPNSGELESMIEITQNCENLIRTLPELIHDETNVEDLNTHGEDHSADALRYGLATFGKVSATFSDVKTINDLLVKQARDTMNTNVFTRSDEEEDYSDIENEYTSMTR